MEVLDKIGDSFTTVTSGIEKMLTGMFGSSNERRVKQFGFVRDKHGNVTITPGSLLDQINRMEPELEKLSDDELRQTAAKLRARLAAGTKLDDLLPEAFAAVRESARRYLHMRHYDVQMVGGAILHQGMIAEMTTGEGKTLVSSLPAFLNALADKVHIVTVNDYLAQRDMEWMGPIHLGLGLTVGAIHAGMSPAEKQAAYACDITYGTNNEFGFDYLRDNMKPTRETQVQGPLGFAIVDEIDNILIDEARTPLIISGPAYDDITKYPKADKIARQLKRDVHFEIKEKEHTCHLTDEGVRYAEELAGVDSFYTAGNMEWPHLIDNSLRAHHLYKRDVNYTIMQGKVVIVDEHTGRLMEGRQWSDGLHQAVEAKEGVQVKQETQTYATITLQNYFKLYKKLAGMTGTAMTEANEFWKIYKLDVVNVPTNRPMLRINYPDVIFRTEKEKWDALVDEIREVHETGRPILVGTVSIEKSELVSRKLDKWGIPHNTLNAKHHEREADIIAQAGRKGAVTIATNMAGRGTDIILGGNPEFMAWEELQKKYSSRLEVPKSEWDDLTDAIAEREGMKANGREVAEVGGLHVIGTERHDSRRIDLQLRGRAGRQGDPGSSRFFLSLEDDLMRIFAGEWVKNMLTRFGMQDGEAIESPMVTRRVEGAQKKVEERHFEMRKNLLEYDEVMDEQRKRVYSYRQHILDGANCRSLILEMIDRQLKRWIPLFYNPKYRWETCANWSTHNFGIEVEPADLRDMDREQMESFLRDQAERQAEDEIHEQIDEALPGDAEDERDWNWMSLSRWVNARFSLNTNDRELKKIGRDELSVFLSNRAREVIAKYDFAPLDDFLAEDFGRRTVAGWVHQQYGLEIPAEKFQDLSAEQAVQLIRDEVSAAYRDKEIDFPVAVGIQNFMASRNQPGEKLDREGLVRWAQGRFNAAMSLEDLKNRERSELEQMLRQHSRSYLQKAGDPEAIENMLSRAFGANGNGHKHDATSENLINSAALQEMIDWANADFEAGLQSDQFDGLDRESAKQKVLEKFDRRFRPELSQAERMLILEVLDTAWKDHLYYMDHLRSGIGLVGYAQKDPKVEYRRQGMKMFEEMWDRIADQVTRAIFRLEKQSPEFVGSLWQITAVSHPSAAPPEAPAAPTPAPAPQSNRSTPEPGGPPPTVDPIRHAGQRVGRNDPCPCGSGKKYKKCCGNS